LYLPADTKPLKLPLTDPMAYEQALSYDPPVREKHEVPNSFASAAVQRANRAKKKSRKQKPKNRQSHTPSRSRNRKVKKMSEAIESDR